MNRRRDYHRSIVWACIVALTGCGDSPAAGPTPPPTPVALHVTAGSDQMGTVTTALAEPLVVTAVDAAGRGLPDIAIAWSAGDGAGQVAGAAVTDRNGRASANWQLGTRAGSVTAVARAGQLEARFTARAAPGAPAVIAQHGAVGADVPAGAEPPHVLAASVADAHGNAVTGAVVRWSADSGTLTDTMSMTDTAGVATTGWQLGTQARAAQASAQHAGLAAVTFAVRVTPGPPHSLTDLTGDGQVATRVGALPVPLGVRVFDRFGNAAAGARHEWSILTGSGAMKLSLLTDSSGYATAEWTLGAVADTQRVEFNAGDLSHVFTAVLQPTTVALANIASIGVGGRVRLSAAAHDADGTTLTGPFVYASAAPHILEVDAAGNAHGVTAGSTTVMAALAGLSASADFEVIEYTASVSGSMIAADSGSAADHVASATVDGATYAAPVHAAGGFTLVGPFFASPFPILIDAVPGTPRRYLPSLISFVPAPDAPHTLSTLLIPAAWQVRGGIHDGASAGISMIDAFRPPCNDAGNANCNGFFPSYWNIDPKVWPASALPVPVAFDHDRSTSPITAADSVAFWQHLAQMNADLGLTYFRPARTAELTVLGDGTANGAILVRTDNTLSGFNGWANWWWNGAGDLYKGRVRLRTSSVLHNSSLVTHEMLHTLGHSHTCSWFSVMGGYGCSSAQRLSVDDVAYAQLAARLKTMRRLTSAQFGIAEALAGEESLLDRRSGFVLAATLSSIMHAAADIEARGFDGAH